MGFVVFRSDFNSTTPKKISSKTRRTKLQVNFEIHLMK